MPERDVQLGSEENIEGALTPFIADALKDVLPEGASAEDVENVGKMIAKMVEEGLDLEDLAEEEEEGEEEPEDMFAPKAAPAKKEAPGAPGEAPTAGPEAPQTPTPAGAEAPEPTAPAKEAPAPEKTEAEGAAVPAEEKEKPAGEAPEGAAPASEKGAAPPAEEAGPEETEKKPAAGPGMMDKVLDKFGKGDYWDKMADKLAEEEGEKGKSKGEVPPAEKAEAQPEGREEAPPAEEAGEKGKSTEGGEGKEDAPAEEEPVKKAPAAKGAEPETAEEPAAESPKVAGAPGAHADKTPRTEAGAPDDRLKNVGNLAPILAVRDILYLLALLLLIIPGAGLGIYLLLDLPFLVIVGLWVMGQSKKAKVFIGAELARGWMFYLPAFLISHAVVMLALSWRYRRSAAGITGAIAEKISK